MNPIVYKKDYTLQIPKNIKGIIYYEPIGIYTKKHTETYTKNNTEFKIQKANHKINKINRMENDSLIILIKEKYLTNSW